MATGCICTSAVEVANPTKKSSNYGAVIWFNARAEIDKLNRTVTLDQLQLTKANFPAEPSKNSELMQLLEAKLPKVTRMVSFGSPHCWLPRLIASPSKTVEVRNDPPAIIFLDEARLRPGVDRRASANAGGSKAPNYSA